MDQITLDRIKILHPKVRKEVLELYTYINNKLLGRHVRLRFAYTLRTNLEQDELFAIGRTKLYDSQGNRIGIVTNAKGGQSIHNYGLAFDIVLLVDKDKNGSFETASWDVVRDFDGDAIADWMEVVNHLKKHGWEWGGDWKGKLCDCPHFEKTFGLGRLIKRNNKYLKAWQVLRDRYVAGNVFTEVIDGKTYSWVNI